MILFPRSLPCQQTKSIPLSATDLSTSNSVSTGQAAHLAQRPHSRRRQHSTLEMSRRTTTTQGKAPGLSRVPSSASLAMPPPKVPTSRPPSVSANAGPSRVDSSTVPQSPQKSSMARRNGPVNGLGNSAKGRSEGLTENGEINIQVVVRCR